MPPRETFYLKGVGEMDSRRLDADETVFFSRQLEYVKAKTYDIKWPLLKARQLIPVSSEAGSGATSITYRQWSQVGIAKIVNSYAKDIPRADILAKEFISPVKSLADGYGYSIQDIRAAKQAGVPLEQRKADAARRGMAVAENQIAFLGNQETGLPGLLTNPNIQQYVIPNDGTGSSKLWANKTATQILRDMTGMVTQIMTVTNGVEKPDTLLLPVNPYAFLSTQLIPNTAITLLDFWLKANLGIRNVEFLNELNGAGAGGTNRMLAYKKDPMYLTLEIPQDFEQFEPEVEGLEWKIACHQRIGGVLVYYPLAMCFADGF